MGFKLTLPPVADDGSPVPGYGRAMAKLAATVTAIGGVLLWSTYVPGVPWGVAAMFGFLAGAIVNDAVWLTVMMVVWHRMKRAEAGSTSVAGKRLTIVPNADDDTEHIEEG